jgi:hypothetical protein
MRQQAPYPLTIPAFAVISASDYPGQFLTRQHRLVFSIIEIT